MIAVPLTVSTVVEEAVLVEAMVVVENTVLADEEATEPELEADVAVVGVALVELEEEKEEELVKIWVAVNGQ